MLALIVTGTIFLKKLITSLFRIGLCIFILKLVCLIKKYIKSSCTPPPIITDILIALEGLMYGISISVKNMIEIFSKHGTNANGKNLFSEFSTPPHSADIEIKNK